MARHFQTQTVSPDQLRPGDMARRANGKYRRVLHTETLGESVRVHYNPNGTDYIARGTEVTIRHRNPVCFCGCGTTTRGGEWAPGHDGRIAGIGARAITGDTDALTTLAGIDPATLPSGGPSRIEHNPDANCDASCQFAHRQLCVCNCGGTGHYMGWVRVGQMLLSQVPEVVTPETQATYERWARYVYTEGQARQGVEVRTGPVAESDRLYPQTNTTVGYEYVQAPNEHGEDGGTAQTVIAPHYDEEDLDSFLRRVIPVVTETEAQVAGWCPESGLMKLDTNGQRQPVVHCQCGRDVPTYKTGRLYRHQTPESATV